MSFWATPTVAAKNAVIAPITVTTVSADGRKLEQRRQPGNHEDARRHHGRGMDEGGDWRRAFHGVGQPGVQQELRRLAHRAHEKKQANHGQRIHLIPEDGHHHRLLLARRGEDRVEIDVAENVVDGEDAQREAEIADAVDDEGLDRGLSSPTGGDTRSR